MLRRFFLFLNVLALIVLLLSCLASYINPNTFWQLSFIGFAFPVVLIINFLFLLVWLAARKKFAAVPAVAIVLSGFSIYSTFAFHFWGDNKEAGIKLMTWNVKNFDLYNWSHNVETRQNMMALIAAENPDVLCMQEFYNNNQLFRNVNYIRDTLGYRYVYFAPSIQLSKVPKTKLQQTLWKSGVLNQQWGVATFSKYPIVDSGMIDFKGSRANDCIYTDINFKGKIVRVFNVHFQSIHLGYDDYATLDSIEQSQKTNWTAVKNIMRKMKRAYTKRADQALAVAERMKAYNGNKIICGDFNDVPVSYAYKTARQNLQDAFEKKGKGFGPTFVNRLSIFRIDYVLLNKNILVNSYRTVRQPLSDHYPVCVSFSL